ncbi:ATP-binding cassette domain-containing protein [Streptomyces sp. NPDC056716]|uniref:ABC transporter ATP-binding protein n=1 Tax=unclassified Streptomyces TaxID=2593676 RepID=UPI00368A0B06
MTTASENLTAEESVTPEANPDSRGNPDSGANPDSGGRLTPEETRLSKGNLTAEETPAPGRHPTPGPHPPALSLRDVRIRDRVTGVEIVHGVSFTLTPGRVVGIVGESGSGKTLTCRAALGILPDRFEVCGGMIEILGTDIAGLSPARWTALRGGAISAVFQDPASYLNPSLRVGAQIAEVVRVKKKLPRRAARRRAVELLRAVHLRDPELVYGQYPHELSGGMLQRVLIATAIAADPRVLVADEATTALDVTVQAEILDLLADLREQTGLALVVVSHDLAVVAHLCDEVLVMRHGEVVEQGPTAQVLHAPRHDYTRLLIDEHEQYGLEKFLARDPDPAPDLAPHPDPAPHSDPAPHLPLAPDPKKATA